MTQYVAFDFQIISGKSTFSQKFIHGHSKFASRRKYVFKQNETIASR